jgi:hypothetical protein
LFAHYTAINRIAAKLNGVATTDFTIAVNWTRRDAQQKQQQQQQQQEKKKRGRSSTPPPRQPPVAMILQPIERRPPVTITPTVADMTPIVIAQFWCRILNPSSDAAPLPQNSGPEAGGGAAASEQQLPTDDAQCIAFPPVDTNSGFIVSATFVAPPREEDAKAAALPFHTVGAPGESDFNPFNFDELVRTLQRGLPLLKRVDEAMRKIFTTRVLAILERYAAAADGSAEREAALVEFATFPVRRLRALDGKVSSRVQLACLRMQLEGDRCIVPTTTLHEQKSRAPREEKTQDEYDVLRVKAAVGLALKGYLSRAAAAIKREQSPDQPFDVTMRNLRALHPQRNKHLRPISEEPGFTPFTHTLFDPKDVVEAINASRHGAAPGPLGWSEEMLADLCESPRAQVIIAQLLTDIANNAVGPYARRVLVLTILKGLPKEGVDPNADGSTRPITLGEALVKMAEKLAGRRARPALNVEYEGI